MTTFVRTDLGKMPLTVSVISTELFSSGRSEQKAYKTLHFRHAIQKGAVVPQRRSRARCFAEGNYELTDMAAVARSRCVLNGSMSTRLSPDG